MLLSQRYLDALGFAFRLHQSQVRKTTGTPYFSHLMAVSSLVIDHGGSEDEAIAALLHDAVEDQGGIKTLEEIRRVFGENVANIVDGCTDSYGKPKQPWQERKTKYLERLKTAGEEVRRVSLADKLHNAYSLHNYLLSEGGDIWGKFNGGYEGTMWYYRSLAQIFRESGNDSMTQDFIKMVQEINKAL